MGVGALGLKNTNTLHYVLSTLAYLKRKPYLLTNCIKMYSAGF